MRSKTGPVEILARAAWLEERINTLPPMKGEGREAWAESRSCHMAAVSELRAEFDQAVPTIAARDDSGTFVIASMGIRSSSTMGIEPAIRNWIRLARQKAQDPDRSL